jgi:hypothetical protein
MLDEVAHHVRRASVVMQCLRVFAAQRQCFAGTHPARRDRMRSDESWTIPLHVIMWTVIAIGLIMAMAVLMMH